MNIIIHPDISIMSLHRAAALIGCELRNTGRGEFVLSPTDLRNVTPMRRASDRSPKTIQHPPEGAA
jgi:hypothetical protein